MNATKSEEAGDDAIVDCEISAYHGVRGRVLEVEETGGYALFRKKEIGEFIS